MYYKCTHTIVDIRIMFLCIVYLFSTSYFLQLTEKFFSLNICMKYSQLHLSNVIINEGKNHPLQYY